EYLAAVASGAPGVAPPPNTPTPPRTQGSRPVAQANAASGASRSGAAPPAVRATLASSVLQPAAAPPAPVVRLIKKKPSAEVKALRVRLEDVERKIHALERRMEEIGGLLSDPKLYADGDRVRTIT